MVSLKKVGIFLQVRINSTRMPAKALEKLDDKTVLQHALERLQIVPADVRAILTNNDSIEMLQPVADAVGWELYIGNSQNVLKRYVDAAIHYGVTVVVRATGDNPFVSSEITRETIDLFSSKNCDLAYFKPIPYGSGVEVVKTEVLIEALNNTNVPYHLEHVTPYIYENRDRFRIFEGRFHDDRVAREDVRLTIDTREDFERMKYLLSEIKKQKRRMKILNIIQLYDKLSFEKIKKILFIVSFGSHYGIGHLKRTLFIAEKLQEYFKIYFSFKYKPNNNTDFISALTNLKIEFIDYDKINDVIANSGSFDRVIVDTRDTSIEEMSDYNSLGPTISIDDNGLGANLSKIVIKTLPSPNSQLSNFEGIEYLFTDLANIKKSSEEITERPKKILVTFGGSDPANLTQLILNIFQSLNYELVLIQGPYFNKKIPLSSGYKVVTNPTVLTPYILDADIVISSFGLTIFESFLLKKPVIIINPSEYHDILTKDISYPYFVTREKGVLAPKQVKDKIANIIQKMIEDNVFNSDFMNSPMQAFYSLKIGHSFNKIVDFINRWNSTSHVCPNCSSFNTKVIHREERYNLLHCKKCDLIYLISVNKKSKHTYNDNYFTEEYKTQYGKSYEDDKENIRAIGKKRLEIIKKYKSKGRILDFGAGLGFFTELCEEEGYKTISIDVSEYAINYIKESLGQEAICSDQNYFEKNDESFDIISSYYVIEHIKDFEKLIFMFTKHLNDNGVIALATPNKNGISIKKRFSQYIKKHPIDHYRIFSPKLLKNILKKYGYKKIKIVITGIHLERFVDMNNMVVKILMRNNFFKSLINNLVNLYAKMFQLGDTFEIYGQKG